MTSLRAVIWASAIAIALALVTDASTPSDQFEIRECVTSLDSEEHLIERGDGSVIDVTVLDHEDAKNRRNRRWVALVPSLGRGAADFYDFGSDLAPRLAFDRFSVVLIEPRGIGQSTGSLDPDSTTMAILADDLDAVFNSLGIDKVSLVGHAFGNRLSRYYTAKHPDRVDRLALLAAGGDFELSEDQLQCLFGSFDLRVPDDMRREHIACAFFAEGNYPDVWMDGWYPATALAQVAAARSVGSDEFKRAGGKPFLLVQPSEDLIAPPDLAGQALKAELGEQVTYVEIEGAGHALLPEKPRELERIVSDYLGPPQLESCP